MKRLMLVLGVGAMLAAAPALAQQQGGRLFQPRPAGTGECPRGDRHCAKGHDNKQAAKYPALGSTNPATMGSTALQPGVPGVGAPQVGVSPVAPVNPLRVEGGGAVGRMPKPEVKAFNPQMKPLGGPGYVPGQR